MSPVWLQAGGRTRRQPVTVVGVHGGAPRVSLDRLPPARRGLPTKTRLGMSAGDPIAGSTKAIASLFQPQVTSIAWPAATACN